MQSEDVFQEWFRAFVRDPFQEWFRAFVRDPRWKHNTVALAQSLAAQTFNIQPPEVTYD